MNIFKKKDLLYRLLIFIFPILFFSVFITVTVLSWKNYRYFTDTIDRDYENIVRSSAGEIQLYIDNAQKSLEAFARVLNATKLDCWQQEIALRVFNQKTSNFMSISVISVSGEKKLVSTGWGGVDIAYGQDEVFRKAIEGQSAISDIILTNESIPYIHLVVPIFHLGKVNAVLWSELNLKAVREIVAAIDIGHTGRVYMMNIQGQLMADRDIIHVMRTPSAAGSEVLDRLRTSENTPVRWTEKKDGVKFYCIGKVIPILQWVVVLSQSDQETYEYLYRNIGWAVLIVCLVYLIAIPFAWYRVRQFLKPIHELHRQTQIVGQGNLDQKVEVTSQDEVGDLSEEFNKMMDSLKKTIEREVEAAKELVHARNLATLGTASSKVTHEVGNLLGNIALATMTIRRDELSERSKESIEILEMESARIKKFIQNFLQFAKKPELKLQMVSLADTLREVLAVHSHEAEKQGIRIDLNWPAHLPPVLADTHLMYQVLNNLVKNGIEAITAPGSILFEGKVDGDYLELIIKDTGSGVRPEILDKIFNPFFTTKGQKGTGLGLPICKTIVEAHRGTIECLSELGRGTTFILRFPL